ncbi:MAG: PCRF domain-containing protein, partial [Deltaproteobacteria bacterium]|nr:PCRF domain-containing protein [Deltaproteobacteria bacterium]
MATQSAKADFWQHPEAAQTLLREQERLKDQIANYERLERLAEEARVFLLLAEEEPQSGAEAQTETQKTLAALEANLARSELEVMLCGEYDRLDAILSIHPGAGGMEAQDWAEMLLRM